MLADIVKVGLGALISLLGTFVVTMINRSDKRREQIQQQQMHEDNLQNARLMQQDTFTNVWRERYWEQREAIYMECLTYAGKMYRFFSELFQEVHESARRDDERSAEELRIARESMAIDGALRIKVQAYCSDEFLARIDSFSGSVQLLARNIIALDQSSVDDDRVDFSNIFETLTSHYLQVIDQARTELAEGHLYTSSSTMADDGD